MIELHLVGGGTWWANPDYFVELREQPDGSTIVVQDFPGPSPLLVHVTETPRHVAEKISYENT